MSFIDHWEIADPSSYAEIWPLMVGRDHEDPIETQHQVAVILEGITQGKRALEVGAGCGRLLKAVALSGLFEQVIGVDSSMSMTLASHGYLEGYGTIELTDGVSLPFPDNHFDFIYSYTAMQHMLSLAIIHRNLLEIHRTLIPGGLCRIQTIASGDTDPRDLKEFDGRVFRDGLEFAAQLRAVGMEIVSIRSGITHPRHIWVTARKP